MIQVFPDANIRNAKPLRAHLQLQITITIRGCNIATQKIID